MNRKIFLSALLLTVSIGLMSQTPKTLHDFKATTLSGEIFDMASLKGKKVLIVNTASKCGLTPQYEKLQQLFDTYSGGKFIIIGFPANNFSNQEPGSNEDIAEFCQKNYGVTFPMMAKISVKGDDMDPIYQWLTRKELNGVSDSGVSWNFQKYLVDEQGKLVKMLPPRTNPLDNEIVEWIIK